MEKINIQGKYTDYNYSSQVKSMNDSYEVLKVYVMYNILIQQN